jgi:hypothetical protein
MRSTAAMTEPSDRPLCWVRLIGTLAGWKAAFLALLLALWPAYATGVEVVVVRSGENEQLVEGKILAEAGDGGLLILAEDGVMWPIQPDEILSRKQSPRPFLPHSADETAKRLLAELPSGFRIHQTAHYTICFNTSLPYAQWCGSLYERLYRGFFNYWKNRGWTLTEPEFRLVALVFDSRKAFANYGHPEVGEAVNSMIGYYNLRTNRVTMFDLTGADDLPRSGSRTRNSAHINQILSQPAAERTVATIVHEATHQLAYNCGLQTRMAANPLWVSEGLALYFESPDYRSDRGWRTIGAVNRVHLLEFRRNFASRSTDSLRTLVVGDERFQDGEQILAAYSEAWALNYFLLNRHRDAYVRYLQQLAQKPPLVEDSPEERLEQFQQEFGDLEALDADFLRYMQRVR